MLNTMSNNYINDAFLMLVTGKEILQDAHKNNYAVGAFNVNNMEIVQAIIVQLRNQFSSYTS